MLFGDISERRIPVIDDFNDNSLSEYNLKDSAALVTQNSVTYEGDYALEFVAGNGSTDYALSSSGLDNYPSQGDTFEFRIYIDSSTSSGDYAYTYWGLQEFNEEVPDGYYAQIGPDVFQLGVVEGGSSDEARNDFNWPENVWCRVEIDWQSTMTMTAFDETDTQLAQVSTTNTPHSSGGYGHVASATPSGTFYTDYHRFI